MKQNDMRDVGEAVLITALCSSVVMLIQWVGKRFLQVDNTDNINVYINNSQLDIDEVEPGEDCECDACKALRK